MDVVFTRFSAHSQRESLGCLQGHIVNDTLMVLGWVPALDMKQLQFAVTGDCAGVPDRVGTWHTHPFRADPRNLPLKEPELSGWDVDSVDAAVKDAGGVRHPVPVITRSPRHFPGLGYCRPDTWPAGDGDCVSDPWAPILRISPPPQGRRAASQVPDYRW